MGRLDLIRFSIKRNNLMVPFIAAILSLAALGPTCTEEDRKSPEPVSGPAVDTTGLLDEHCRKYVGEPRVERISERVWAVMGYDLAHTVLINTDKGSVIVDTAMSPARAHTIRQALEAEAPVGKILAIIYTHSHIDHVGGASVWAEEGTEIWATDIFTEHFLKQYGMFRPSETVRAMRQFGHHIGKESLPCSALGARMDIKAAMKSGVMLPTHTFSREKTLEIGGVTIKLVAAPGETHDQLFVWLPQEETLIPGDNFYYAFPNLYTIRGCTRRPVKEWIHGIDRMRALNPRHMIPCHTKAVHGKEKIARVLTDYRDAIQWVHDEVVRRANRLEDIDTIKESIELPDHLASKPYLQELYGQVDWSAHAIYTNYQGWFDGSAEDLYPLPEAETARREIRMMGGVEEVLSGAEDAIAEKDGKWAVHLLAKLKKSGMLNKDQAKRADEMLAQSYRMVAAGVSNTNGRAYLVESALELEHKRPDPQSVKVGDDIIESVPLEMIFSIMTTRLKPAEARDVHESVHFVFPDVDRRFIVTVRYGVVEVVEGKPLPYTPEPVATLIAGSLTYRRIALGLTDSAKEVVSGNVKIKGSIPKLIEFQDRFQAGI